jgi:hypothetical protein
MSATPANVSSGRISEIAPAIRNRTPKIHRIHRVAPPVSEPKTRFCAPAARNMIPMSTPTVVIEAWSNWRITSAPASQNTPVASQTHQRFATSRNGFGTCALTAIAMSR